MHNKNILFNFSLIVISVFFIGCGGRGSSVDNSTTNKPPIKTTYYPIKSSSFNYQTELSKAPKVIQDAMNSYPPQYVSSKEHLVSFKNKNFSANVNISAVPTILNNDKGYSFITVKIDNEVMGEGVYAWDKALDMYPVGFRALSATDKTSNSLNHFDFRYDIKSISKNLNSQNCSELADLLTKGNFVLSLNASRTNNDLLLTNVILGLNGTNINLPNFNGTLDDNIGIALKNYLIDFLKF